MRIQTIEIHSFRGIPKELKVNFPIRNQKPVSLIITGDNGSGKSSIVDAIEFCLQAHISQSESFTTERIPSAISYSNKSLPNVSVFFDSNEAINRRLIKDEQGYLFNKKEAHTAFAISPFVLRRHDLLRFLDSSDAQRTLVFRNYLKNIDGTNWIEHPEDELNRLQDERLKIKFKRDELIEKLAFKLNVQASDIPIDRKLFSEFINERLYRGFSKKRLIDKGFRINVKAELEELVSQIQQAIDENRELRSKISKFSISPTHPSFPKHLVAQMQDFLNMVGKNLTESFLEISPVNYLDHIDIAYDSSSVLAFVVQIILKNGQKCHPKQILSEANLDLLALLFFISVIKESAARGQAKLIILDDVLQSVDSVIRVSFISFLLK